MWNGNDIVVMGHGGGGRLTRELIDGIIGRELGNPILDTFDDAACVTVPETELAISTDSYVVMPVFFPGGDIGRLAVCGTVNDLTVQGAEPRYMSLSLIIEEGLRLSDLERIIHSVGVTAKECNVPIVTGDTKVIERRHGTSSRGESGGGIFVNTTGLGIRLPGVDVSVANARAGDTVIVTGTLGDHGIAVLNARNELELEMRLESDVAPLWDLLGGLLRTARGIHCMRDPTRGGLAAALCDIAESSSCRVVVEERALPVRPEVRAACDLLGFDPVNLANEGKAVIVCAPESAADIVRCLRSHPLGNETRIIGRVESGEPAGRVMLETRAGGERIIDMPAGNELPRIC